MENWLPLGVMCEGGIILHADYTDNADRYNVQFTIYN